MNSRNWGTRARPGVCPQQRYSQESSAHGDRVDQQLPSYVIPRKAVLGKIELLISLCVSVPHHLGFLVESSRNQLRQTETRKVVVEGYQVAFSIVENTEVLGWRTCENWMDTCCQWPLFHWTLITRLDTGCLRLDTRCI